MRTCARCGSVRATMPSVTLQFSVRRWAYSAPSRHGLTCLSPASWRVLRSGAASKCSAKRGENLRMVEAASDRFAAFIAEEYRAADGAEKSGRIEQAWCHLERAHVRSEEHTSELQSLMRISYAVFCLKKK